MLSVEPFYLLAALMFLIGAAGMLVKRNAIAVFMCIELMLNAANLTFITGSFYHNSLNAQIVVLIVMTVAAAEAAIGLAIVLALFRTKKSIDISDANSLSDSVVLNSRVEEITV